MMGISTNGNDCKHEKMRVNWASGFLECLRLGCDFIIFEQKDVVILTKAYDQLREDVLEAGRELIVRDNEYTDGLNYGTGVPFPPEVGRNLVKAKREFINK